MVLLEWSKFNLWIQRFFAFFTSDLFTVGDITFSFYDIFIGGLTLSCIGYVCGQIIFFIKDKR